MSNLFVNLKSELGSDTSFYKRKSKLEVVPAEKLEKIAKLIHSRKLSYKKATELLVKEYPELEGMTLQTLRYYLIHKGFIPNKTALENDYKRLSKQEVLKRKREIIAEILFEEILEDKEKTLKLLESIVSKNYTEEEIEKIVLKVSDSFKKIIKQLLS